MAVISSEEGKKPNQIGKKRYGLQHSLQIEWLDNDYIKSLAKEENQMHCVLCILDMRRVK